MTPIENSQRIEKIEQNWGKPIGALLHTWHWKQNLMHKQIGKKVGIPRPTITRWFHQFKVPTQKCFRFTNQNLLNIGPRKTPPAKPEIKKEFSWKYNRLFFKTWSRKMAYILGFVAADGYVFKNPRGSHYLGFSSNDKELLIKIRAVLGSNHKIGIKKRKKQNLNWKKHYVLQIGGKDMVGHLRKFGIVQNKSLVIKFPKIPRKYLGDFVRGYFDGDGCVHFRKHYKKDRDKLDWTFRTDFTSGSKKFLLGLANSLRKTTKGGFLYSKKGGYNLTFSRQDSVALFKLMYNNVASRLFLERKHEIFLRAFRTLNYKVAGVA